MTEAARLLRYARRRAGLTQRALAARAGVGASYVGRVESGRTDPRVSSLSRLLRACETTLEAMPGSGRGIDRAPIRHLLAMTPAERVALEDPAPRVLRALLDAEVPFVVIGDRAAHAHGSPSASLDVDVCAAGPVPFDDPFLDVHPAPYGTGGYDDLAASAQPRDIGGVVVPVASRADVVRMKRAYGRPKDLIEVESLVER